MKLTLKGSLLQGSVALIINFMIINYLTAQNVSVCPIGVGMEPVSKSESASPSKVKEVYSPYFMKWTEMMDVKFSDDKEAKVLLPDFKRSRQIMGNNLKFQLPAGAVVNGITLMIEGQSSNYRNIDELEVVLVGADGSPKGTNKANTAILQKAWSARADGSDHIWMYGSHTDTWGTAWNATDINHTNFGFQLQLRNIENDSINIFIDKIEIIVHYTPLYSFCDAKCLTFYIDKLEQQGSYEWQYPEGFDMVSASTGFQAIDLKIDDAAYGVHNICVNIYDKTGNYTETCCRNFLYQNCSSAEIKGIVWSDLNDNKLRDPGEGILVSVPLVLYKEGNIPVDTLLSDSFGKYHFKNLQEGKYYIKAASLPDYKMIIYSAVNTDINSDITHANGTGTTDLLLLETGKCLENIDFGYAALGSIGDFVWLDKNYNGLQDSLEIGLKDVKIYLHNGGGTIIDSTVSDINGAYRFNNLSANTYYLKFKAPVDFLPTFKSNVSLTKNSKIDADGFTPAITYSNTGFRNDVDAGFYQTARIGDQVWLDNNGNGIRNTGELPVPNIEIILTGVAGNGEQIHLITQTNQDGRYSFNNLKPGIYNLRFNVNDQYLFTVPNIGDDKTKDSDPIDAEIIGVVVSSGDLNLSFDAGLYNQGSISNFVWEDLNGNGVQDANELGLEHILVTIFEFFRDEIIEVDAEITDENGHYFFFNLKPGVYRIIFTLPDGYMFSPPDFGTDDSKDSDAIDGIINGINLKSGEHNDTYDAGLYRKASIGDFVWEDRDRNGIQDFGETGVSDVQISLTGVAGDGSVISLMTSTGLNGLYRFNNLKPGIYSLQISEPDGFQFTLPDQGADDGNDSDVINGSISNVTIISGESELTLDAGLIGGITLGDFVWDDQNSNGIQDMNEPGIEGVNIMLSGFTFGGIGVNASIITNSAGHYSFQNIFPGTYEIGVQMPTGYSPTVSFAGSDTNLDSNLSENNSSISTTILSNQSDLSIDIGLLKFGTIGDLVWEDLNCNNIREANEPGIQGVHVFLVGEDIFSSIINKQATTDQNGHYIFEQLKPGNYEINFEVPSGYFLSMALTNVVTLQNGQNILNIDAPFFRTGSIGDMAWFDTNENGIMDSEETGISNIKVVLRSLNFTNEVFTETTTDVQGKFIFGNLKPGSYSVQFDIPEGYKTTLFKVGTDDNLDSDVDENGLITPIVIASGENSLHNDAGFIDVSEGIIGDFVWEDINGNGLQDTGEPGISNNRVFLSGLTNNGTVITRETTTDFFGLYEFNLLPAGQYNITFEKKQGFLFTNPDIGSDDSIDSDADVNTGITSPINLSSTTLINDIDAGFYRYSSIGDFVWNDLNNNGLQDLGEPGIEGVILTLINDLGEEVASAVTGNFGFYFFSNISPGEYKIVAEIQSNFVPVLINPANEQLNSDFTIENGLLITSKMQINSNTILFDIDLGLIAGTGSQSGFAWFDANGDGMKNGTENGLNGIVVYLLDEMGDTISIDTTDLAGSYHFENLNPGSYVIEFQKPDTLLFTSSDQGFNDETDSDV
ncbi:MAG: hypothetical protein H7X99_11635, partial [Saprospiraceae bacterium]|nr:hypothetical protein [Saprospiraceae bacterium]